MTEEQKSRLLISVQKLQDKAIGLRKEHPEMTYGATGMPDPSGYVEDDPGRCPVCTEWTNWIEPEWSNTRKIVDEILASLPKPDRSKLKKLTQDNLWIWGGPTPYWGGSLSDDTLIRGAAYFDIQNAFYVYGPTSEKMISIHSGFRNLLCQVNSLCRAEDQLQKMTDVEMAGLVGRLSLKYRNVKGAICDDATQYDEKLDAEPFRKRYEALKKYNPELKMYLVVYAHEMKPEKDFSVILPYVDGINFWCYSMEEFLEYDKYVQICQKKFPKKPIIQGIFLHEYCRSDAGTFPELLEYQLDKAREYLTKGVLQGVILLGDREIKKWPESAKAVRNYLKNQFRKNAI